MRSNFGCIWLAMTGPPQHFAVTIASVPISGDLVRDIVSVEAAEDSGGKECASLASSVEIPENAPADRCHDPAPGIKHLIVIPMYPTEGQTMAGPALFGPSTTAESGTSCHSPSIRTR